MVFLLAVHSPLYKRILLPPLPSKCGLQCKYCLRNLKSEVSPDCPKTPTKLYVHEFGYRPNWRTLTVLLSQKSLRKIDRLKALFYIRSTKKPSRKNVVKNCNLVFSWCANKYKVFNCKNMFCRVKTRVSECWFLILHQLSLKKGGGRKGSMPLNLRVRMQSRSLHTQSKSKMSETLNVGWRRENIELLRTFTFNPGKKASLL